LSSYLPVSFIRSLQTLDHFDLEAFLAVHGSGDQLASVHMNPGKRIMTDGKWLERISEPPFEISGKVPWAPDAYYLSSRPRFTLDPLFHAGTYYVQEASGMFLAFALQQTVDLLKKVKLLDLCAAPGGKSTMMQSLITSDSLLLSNEVIKTRVPVLHQNMTKWGNANSFISNNDPFHFKQLPGFFDVMLVDAPCSGSGLFRKDPEAAKEWSEDLVHLCSQRQQRILADSWDCLKEEGYLIYSTCSYSKEENEDMLDHIFQQYNCLSIPLTPDPEWQIIETNSDLAGAFGYRFYPDKLQGEGFFLSVIQKKEAVQPVRANKNRNPEKLPKAVLTQLEAWLKAGSYELFSVGDSYHALQPGLSADFEMLKNNLYLKKAGVRVGKAGEKDWIPDHEMALANFLKEEMASLELTKPDALRFLRGEPFDAGSNRKGWQLVRFAGQPLGWVKLLDKRMNNYYPKSWRIRL
jgi:16S rRNA C967 or C1407 C5-methylase (RsmB/RsmF family)/NOL1/NOP2/fmu family ribosome biogenesis protein